MIDLMAVLPNKKASVAPVVAPIHTKNVPHSNPKMNPPPIFMDDDD